MKDKKKSKIKVKHVAVANTLAIDSLFNAIVAAVKLPYATLELEAEGLAAAKVEFAKEIHCMVAQAFRTGKKIGNFKADSKDTEMYTNLTDIPATL